VSHTIRPKRQREYSRTWASLAGFNICTLTGDEGNEGDKDDKDGEDDKNDIVKYTDVA